MRAKRVGLSLSLSFRTHTYTVSSKSSTTQGTSKHKRFLNYSVSRSCCSCSCFFIVVTYKMRVSRERRARWALRVLRITDATLRSCKTHTHTQTKQRDKTKCWPIFQSNFATRNAVRARERDREDAPENTYKAWPKPRARVTNTCVDFSERV